MDFDRRYVDERGRFRTGHDLVEYLQVQNRTWGKGKRHRSNFVSFSKRFSSVWVTLLFTDDHYSNQCTLFLNAQSVPLGRRSDTEELVELELDRVAIADIESAAKQLAGKVQQKQNRVPKSFSKYFYPVGSPNYHGKEAIEKWKERVTAALLDDINTAASGGMTWTTRLIVENALENHSIELGGVSRSEQSQMIVSILQGLVAKGKIDRWADGPEVEWAGKNFVQKKGQ